MFKCGIFVTYEMCYLWHEMCYLYFFFWIDFMFYLWIHNGLIALLIVSVIIEGNICILLMGIYCWGFLK